MKINSNGQYKQFFLNKPLYFYCRLLLGLIFVVASIDKFVHPAAFAEVLYNYQILPDILINITAVILPWLELILGIFLVLGLWLPGAVFLGNFLLAAFFGSLVFNLARGLDIYCGCFSATEGAVSNANMYLYVIRDGIFLFLGLYLFSNIFLRKDHRLDF